MVKVSIGLFLLRLAASKLYRHVCVGFIVIMSTYSFASALTIIFQCYPVRAIWDVSTPNANCMSTQVRLGLGYSYSIVTIISDFFLVVLPVGAHRPEPTCVRELTEGLDRHALARPDPAPPALHDLRYPLGGHVRRVRLDRQMPVRRQLRPDGRFPLYVHTYISFPAHPTD